MKFKITLTSSSTPVDLTVKLLEEYPLTVVGTTDIEFDANLKLGQEYLLEIIRNDASLYTTNKTTHSSYVTINQILIDDFWAIGDKNHWSKTYYDSNYVEHLKDKPVTWELSKDLYNNVLFFNGKITYTITKPIREMFFK